MEEVQYPKVVAGVVIYNHAGEIFLAKGTKWDGRWVVPGGHLEWGETLEDCVKREVLEETALVVEDIHLLGVQESIFSPEFHKPKHMIFIDYYCKLKSGTVALNSEASEYAWVNPEKAVKTYNLGSSTKVLIENFVKYLDQAKH